MLDRKAARQELKQRFAITIRGTQTNQGIAGPCKMITQIRANSNPET